MNEGNPQWDASYPDVATITNDLQKQSLYALYLEDDLVGVVSLCEEQEIEYETIDWIDQFGRFLVIHRLAVHPDFQGQGLSKHLMEFAEGYARLHHYSSIRLDTYSANRLASAFYEKTYQYRGQLFFSKRPLPYNCYEKLL